MRSTGWRILSHLGVRQVLFAFIEFISMETNKLESKVLDIPFVVLLMSVHSRSLDRTFLGEPVNVVGQSRIGEVKV